MSHEEWLKQNTVQCSRFPLRLQLKHCERFRNGTVKPDSFGMKFRRLECQGCPGPKKEEKVEEQLESSRDKIQEEAIARHERIKDAMDSLGETHKYHCPIHGPYNEAKIGKQTTKKCIKCINEKRSKAQTGRKRSVEPQGVPFKPDSNLFTVDPPPQTISAKFIEATDKTLKVDFSDYPELLEQIKEMAAEEVRTPAQQVVYCVKKMVGNAA